MNTTYEVWALGYDQYDMATPIEEYLGERDTEDEAITFAVDNYQEISDVFPQKSIQSRLKPGDKLEIRVEKVVSNKNKLDADVEAVYSFILEA